MCEYYKVYVTVEVSGYFIIKADDIEEAKTLAKERAFDSGDFNSSYEVSVVHPIQDRDITKINTAR